MADEFGLQGIAQTLQRMAERMPQNQLLQERLKQMQQERFQGELLRNFFATVDPSKMSVSDIIARVGAITGDPNKVIQMGDALFKEKALDLDAAGRKLLGQVIGATAEGGIDPQEGAIIKATAAATGQPSPSLAGATTPGAQRAGFRWRAKKDAQGNFMYERVGNASRLIVEEIGPDGQPTGNEDLDAGGYHSVLQEHGAKLDRFTKDFNTEVKKQNESISAANIVRKSVETGDLPMALKAVPIMLARAAGAAPISAAEAAGFQSVQALTSRLNQLLETWRTGRFTDENRQEVRKIADVFIEGAINNKERIARERALQFSDSLNMQPYELFREFVPETQITEYDFLAGAGGINAPGSQVTGQDVTGGATIEDELEGILTPR
jgi:hypothetical protein